MPVVLTRENVQIRCPSFVYRDADDRVSLMHSKEFPQVEIMQFATSERAGKPDLTLLSETVDYEPSAGVATLLGKSRRYSPPTHEQKAADSRRRRGTSRASPLQGRTAPTRSSRVSCSGDVDVRHPQVSLQSQRLNLAFDPPDAMRAAVASASASRATRHDAPRAKQPVVRQVIADDAVHCVLVDETGGRAS
jgi:hypothetical protein